MAQKKSGGSPFVYSTDPNFVSKQTEVSQGADLTPAQQKLRVRLETKQRAGKAMTIVDGYVGSDPHLEKLGRDLKSYCGTGGSVKDGQILIQGDNREKVLQWLKKNGYSQAK